jgi:hypothetical protein
LQQAVSGCGFCMIPAAVHVCWVQTFT